MGITASSDFPLGCTVLPWAAAGIRRLFLVFHVLYMEKSPSVPCVTPSRRPGSDVTTRVAGDIPHFFCFLFSQFLKTLPAVVRDRNPWVSSSRLVVKPDQLIKRRGKSGLLLLNATWEDAKAWVNARVNTEVDVDGVKGVLDVFIVEPFVPHGGSDEYYICLQSHRFGEEILFHHEVATLLRAAHLGTAQFDLDCFPFSNSRAASTLATLILSASVFRYQRRPVFHPVTISSARCWEVWVLALQHA